MRRYIGRTLLLIVAMVSFGCSSLVNTPQVEIRRASLVSLDTSGADIELYLSVTNPNMFDLSLLGCTYDLRVMTLPLFSGGLQESTLFRSGSKTDMRLPLRIKFSDMAALLKRRPDPDSIPYELNARFQVRTFAGEMTIPVEKSSTFAIPEEYRPAYYLDRFRDILK